MSDKNEWLPVPSLNYKYELCSDGRIRNAVTKHILKKKGTHNGYFIRNEKKYKYTSILSLLWEVYGILPENPTRNKPIPVTIKKGTDALYFPSQWKAAKYLAPKCFYHVNNIHWRMRNRVTEICGWQIAYHLPDDLSRVEYKGLRIKKYNR